MRKIVFVLISILAIFIISCNNKQDNGTFEIYFLSDSSLSFLDVDNISLSNIKNEPNPIITTDDIFEYRILYIPDNPMKTHTLFLNESKQQELGNKKRPFLVKANNKKIYIGEYWPEPSGGDASYGITMVHMISGRYYIMSNNESDNDLINHDKLISALENSEIEIIYKDISNR